MADSKAWINKSRLGGLRCIELHGNPGTPEGRSKGGRKTIRLFHQNPAFARKVGFIIRKEIKYPKKCIELAEFFGIILGDGGLPGNHQLTIAFNNKTDQEYSLYLKKLLKQLFSIDCHVHYRKNNNGADIVVNSSNLVDFLLKKGLSVGNKVKNQVGIPIWIHRNLEYQKACLRGLMDTDGSFYSHKYISGGKEYKYLKLCFTNCSKPILNFVFKILKDLDYKVYLDGNHVSIYSRDGVKRYFTEIGAHNQKHLNKFKEYLANYN
jgi:hypothetical protein